MFRRRSAKPRPVWRARRPLRASSAAGASSQRRAELGGEALGRMLPAPELAHRVGRDIGDDVGRRALDMCSDELGGQAGHAAEPALLPRTDERAGRAAVGDGRARAREGEAPPRTLAALARPATRSERRNGHSTAAPSGRSSSRQPAQSRSAALRQATQERGSRRSTSHASNARAGRVTCLSRNRAREATIRASLLGRVVARAPAGRQRRAAGCPPPAAARGSRCRTRSSSKTQP